MYGPLTSSAGIPSFMSIGTMVIELRVFNIKKKKPNSQYAEMF